MEYVPFRPRDRGAPTPPPPFFCDTHLWVINLQEIHIFLFTFICSSIDTSKRLKTVNLEKTTAGLPEGVSIENKVFLLQRRGSLQTSKATLKDFGESKL